jgi:hypothetical protein
MCYTNGPRCSKEGRKAYDKALKKGNTAEIERAKIEYYTTSDGISELKEKGLNDLANKFSERRKIMIATSKTIDRERAAQKERKARYEESLKNSPTKESKPWAAGITPVFKTRKAKVAVVAGTGFLAASLLTGCSTSDEAEYAAVCQDAKSQQRVSDDKCSNGSGSGGSSAYMWYFMGMNSQVPAVGAPLSGGTPNVSEEARVKSGVNTSGETVTREGFGRSGAASKSGGFGSGGAKGAGRGGGGGKVNGG